MLVNFNFQMRNNSCLSHHIKIANAYVLNFINFLCISGFKFITFNFNFKLSKKFPYLEMLLYTFTKKFLNLGHDMYVWFGSKHFLILFKFNLNSLNDSRYVFLFAVFFCSHMWFLGYQKRFVKWYDYEEIGCLKM